MLKGDPMHRPLICVTSILFSASACWSQVQTLTKAELLAGAEAYADAMESIIVSDTVILRDAGPEFGMAWLEETVSVKGPKILWEFTYGPNPARDPAAFHRIVSFDGSVSVGQQSTLGQVLIDPGRNHEARSQDRFFFDLSLMNAPRSAGGDQSLVSLLRSSASQVRPQLEEAGGALCHVVEFVRHAALGPRQVVWIDTQRGYLPVRQVFYTGTVPRAVQMEYVVEDAIELPSGHWVPVSGWKQVGDLHWDFAVQRNPAGQYRVEVNTIGNDAIFRLQDRLPAGFLVHHRGTGELWTVANGDYERGAATLASVIRNQKLDRHGVRVQSVDKDLSKPRAASASILSLAGIGALCTLALGLVRRRVFG